MFMYEKSPVGFDQSLFVCKYTICLCKWNLFFNAFELSNQILAEEETFCVQFWIVLCIWVSQVSEFATAFRKGIGLLGEREKEVPKYYLY